MGNKIGFLTGLTVFLLFAVPMVLEIQKTQVTSAAIQQIAHEVTIFVETEGGKTPRVDNFIAEKTDYYAEHDLALTVEVNKHNGEPMMAKESPATPFTVKARVEYAAWFQEQGLESKTTGIILKR